MKSLKNYTVQNNNGEDFIFHDFQADKNLLVIFFRGAWCNHCKKQLQDLQKNISEIEKFNVNIIAISSDSKMNSSILKTFLKLSFPVLSDSDCKIINDYNLKASHKGKEVSKPAVYIYNKKHEEIFNIIGDTYDDRLSAEALIKTINNLSL